MSKFRIRGSMPHDIWEKIKVSEHTNGGSWDTNEGEQWLTLHWGQGENRWELSSGGVTNLNDHPFDEPDHGPCPFTMPMPDQEWEKVRRHTADPDTGLLGSAGKPTYKVVAVVNNDLAKAKAKAVVVED